MADRISARRATANSFFLTAETALIALVAFVASARRAPSIDNLNEFDAFAVGLIAANGTVLSLTWWLLLRSYRDLNRAKFRVIQDIEAQLPVTPFRDEWSYLKEDPVPWWRRRYAELGFVERIVPILFLAIHVVVAVRVVLS